MPQDLEKRRQEIERLRREIEDEEFNNIVNTSVASIAFLFGVIAGAKPTVTKVKDLIKGHKDTVRQGLELVAAAAEAATNPAAFVKAVWDLLKLLVEISGGFWNFVKSVFELNVSTAIQIVANLVSWLGGPLKTAAIVANVAAFVWSIASFIDGLNKVEENKRRLRQLELEGIDGQWVLNSWKEEADEREFLDEKK